MAVCARGAHDASAGICLIWSLVQEASGVRYQCRFKLPGRFRSLEGDADFLFFAILRHTGRWN